MGPQKNIPADSVRLSRIIYDNKKALLGGQVVDGMPMFQVLCLIDKIFEAIFSKGGTFESIDLKDLGISDCIPEGQTKESLIMQWLIENMRKFIATSTTLQTTLQTLQTAISTIKDGDEKVKVRAAGTAGYLADLISAPATNMKVEDNKITFLGFVPIGFRATINKNRIGDFDSTGKGKPNTDLWGWAIRNGQNGLTNALGTFPMYTDALGNADMTGGEDKFTVSKSNIGTMALPVTGTISESLQDNQKFKIGWIHHRSFDGKDGADQPIKDEKSHNNDAEWYTPPYNFKHTHGFNLAATHTNANPTPIPLIPKHIKEIPIERINP